MWFSFGSVLLNAFLESTKDRISVKDIFHIDEYSTSHSAGSLLVVPMLEK